MALKDRPFVVFLAAWPPGRKPERGAQLSTGNFLGGFIRAYDAWASAARDIQQFCRAGNGVLTSRSEHVGDFRCRAFGSVFLRASPSAE